MSKIHFGETVDGYDIPVLNEREIRAAAGLLFLMMYTLILIIGFTENYTPFKYGAILFFLDFVIRVLINPKYSPTLILGRFIVRNQVPEYVGAQQKKFAWWIGLILATTIIILMVIVNAYSPITGIICLICLIFLFFEAVFGICLGCKFYSLVYKDKAQYCPGEVCDVKDRHEIQKLSSMQWVIVLGFTVAIVLVGYFLGDFLSIPPHDLFGLNN